MENTLGKPVRCTYRRHHYCLDSSETGTRPGVVVDKCDELSDEMDRNTPENGKTIYLSTRRIKGVSNEKHERQTT